MNSLSSHSSPHDESVDARPQAALQLTATGAETDAAQGATRPPANVRQRNAGSAAHGGVRGVSLVPTPPPSLKALQLFQEARRASLEHLVALRAAIATVSEMSDAVVEGGDLYTPGLNDFARRLSEDLVWKSKTLDVLLLRQREVLER